MIRRLFWLLLGASLGGWAAFRLKRLVRAVTPQGLTRHATGLGRTVRTFTTDVRTQMHTREDELRYALGLDTHADLDADIEKDRR